MRTVLFLILFPVVLAVTGAPSIDGSFALERGTAKTNGYLHATAGGGDPLSRKLDFWMTPKDGAHTIRRYTVDMTKLLHVIVISDDFTQFMHVHPKLGADGHFTIDQKFPARAMYHVYADGEPTGIGPQVFRFDLPLGASAAHRDLEPTRSTVSAGPYAVALGSTHLTAGRRTALTVHVTRAGRPATDLHPYLGALAHVVVIDARDLSYVHVHPMPLEGGDAMGGMSMPGMASMDMPAQSASSTSSPDMKLHLALREPGTYKMWFQFRGGTSLYVAPFILTVR